MQRVIGYAENHGYPFASIRLDSIKLQGNDLSASLNYQSGPVITFDTLKVAGDSNTKISFLQNYLRIQPDQPFSMKRVEEAEARLARLPFLKSAGPNQLTFQNR